MGTRKKSPRTRSTSLLWDCIRKVKPHMLSARITANSHLTKEHIDVTSLAAGMASATERIGLLHTEAAKVFWGQEERFMHSNSAPAKSEENDTFLKCFLKAYRDVRSTSHSPQAKGGSREVRKSSYCFPRSAG